MDVKALYTNIPNNKGNRWQQRDSNQEQLSL